MGKGPDFIGVKFSCDETLREILIAELSNLGYNSMMETEDGIEAFIEKDDFIKKDVYLLKDKYPGLTNASLTIEEVSGKNWNKEWEKNFEPIVIEGKCLVRATFHPPNSSVDYEVVINPRMSFGTGHHATTYLMLALEMEIELRDKRVLDAGCGTGILAIMAEKLGAEEVIAYDNDAWSIDNAPENIGLNNCSNITVLAGTIGTLRLAGKFDIILANINKNILLEEMNGYCSYLQPGGYLVLSGFYTRDSDDMLREAEKNNLTVVGMKDRDDWAALVFLKK